MRELAILCLLIAWAYPYHPIQANQDPMVFQIDETLNDPKYVTSPTLKELQTETPKTKTKSTTPVVRRNNPKNKFVPGNCTYYVAERVNVTWSGNANRWIANARSQGYLVNRTPVPGAILVTAESKLGHVAYIESVDGTKFTISEWNYTGLFKLHTRTLDISDPIIKGIIHVTQI